MRLAVLIFAIAMGSGGMARAGLELCNSSGFSQSVAVGYKDGEDWVSRGWWNLDPGECKEPVKGDLKQRYYYIFASARGRAFTPEKKYTFCTQSAAFTITGDTACKSRGYDINSFARIDTGKTAKQFSVSVGAGYFTQTAPPPKPPHVEMQEIAAGMLPIRQNARPGQLGEPFSQTGIFQGCEQGEEGAWCAVHSDGWKFYAYYGGGTPDWMLDKLEFLPVGTPVGISGDMIYFGDITVEVALREVTHFPGLDLWQAQRIAMQGMWRSADDPSSEIYIEGAELQEIYGGEWMSRLFLQIAPRCEDAPDVGPVLIQTDPESRDSYCYLIEDVSDDRLELIYFGNPDPLVYRR